MYQLFVGLFTEGKTDNRFLKSIVEKTIYKIAANASQDIEVNVQIITIEEKGKGFTQQVLNASKNGLDWFGIHFLCVHKDADSPSDTNTFEYQIQPAQKALESRDYDEYCKILVPIVPIQEMEAWMLVDKELLKKQIGTNKSDKELGINKPPEQLANPKEVIKNAIVIARQGFTKRRRRQLTISQLYLPIGQEIDIEKLNKLSSYQKFSKSIIQAFAKLNLLH